jgi:hypothetical protein
MCQDMIRHLDLVAKDLCEAHAANSMLTDMMSRDRLADFNGSEARFGLWFIAGSLALRMALAVNRTLQGASNDKASFARLLKLAKAAHHNAGLTGFEMRLDELRNGPTARKLHECRNRFMAHSWLSRRDEVQPRCRPPLRADRPARGHHRAVIGTEDRVVSKDLEKWRGRARETWDAPIRA